MKKTILLALILTMLLSCFAACDSKIFAEKGSEGLEFSSNGSLCEVVGIGTCTDTDIVIPKYAPDGAKVRGIDASAFRDCVGLTSVIIPASVENIGSRAFAGCSNLTSVDLGDGLESLGFFAFEDCISLTSIVIPDSTESLCLEAFVGCTSLTSITFEGTVDQLLECSLFDTSTHVYYIDDLPNAEIICSDGTISLMELLSCIIP